MNQLNIRWFIKT